MLARCRPLLALLVFGLVPAFALAGSRPGLAAPGDPIVFALGRTTTNSPELFKIDAASGNRTVWSRLGDASQGPTIFPRGVTAAADGTVLLAGQDLANPDHGLLVRVALDGSRTLVSDFTNVNEGQVGFTPWGLSPEANGDVLVTDRGQGGGGNGAALWEVHPDGTRIKLSDFTNASQGPVGNSPEDVAVAADGTIYAVDAEAGSDCHGFGDLCGLLFTVQPLTGMRTVVSDFGNAAQGPFGDDPGSIVFDAAGAVLVGDPFAGSNNCSCVAIFRVDLATGHRTLVTDYGNAAQGEPGQAHNPGVAVLPDGRILSIACNGPSGFGAICAVDRTTGTRTIFSDFGNAATGDTGFFGTDLTVSTAPVVSAGADLETSITAAPNPVLLPGTTTLTATVMNGGPADATGVHAAVTLPPGLTFVSASPAAAYDAASGTWTIGSLADGASATLRIVANVTFSGIAGLHVTGDQADSNSANDAASVAVGVELDADLAAQLTAAPARPAKGANVTLAATITDKGPFAASNVVARLQLPPGVAFVSSSAGAAFDPATGAWTIGAIPNGSSATMQVVVTVTGDSPVLTLQTVSLDQTDPAGGNNTASVTLDPPGLVVGGACTLRAAIVAANTDAPSGGCPAGVPGLDTIVLQSGSSHVYSDVYETPAGIGPDALPAVTSPITIDGRGSTIGRSTAAGTPSMRVFFVANGGSLTLDDVTVRDGAASGPGGGIRIQAGGALTMTGGAVTGNTATGDGGAGIYAEGTATLTGVVVSDNHGGQFGGGLDVLGVPVTLKDDTFTGNSAGGGGGIASGGGTVDVETTTISGNSAATYGGGIYANGTFTLTDSTVGGATASSGNTALWAGGGIFAGDWAALTVTRGSISSNVSKGSFSLYGGGGGLAVFPPSSAANRVTLSSVHMNANTAVGDGDGGAIFNQGHLAIYGGTIENGTAKSGGGIANGTSTLTGGDVVVTGAEINGNTVTDQGGGIFNRHGGTLELVGATLDGNSAGSTGGNLSNYDGAGLAEVFGGKIVNGTAATGGGIYSSSAQLRLTDGVDIESNLATGSGGGGGVYVVGPGILGADGATFRGNRATFFDPVTGCAHGAAVHLVGVGFATLYHALVTGHAAGCGVVATGPLGGGGTLLYVDSTTFTGNTGGETGLEVSRSTVIASNDTFSANSGSQGPIVVLDNNSFVYVDNTTIAGNTIGVPGHAAIERPFGTGWVQIANSIVLGNRLGTGYADCTAGVASGGHNLVGANTGCPSNGAGDLVVPSGDAFTKVLAPLADNGGYASTHALLAGSPAIDAAGPQGPQPVPWTECFTLDGRGLPRPKDGDGVGGARCDIGAFEQQTPLLAPLTLTGIAPATAKAGSAAFTLSATGAGFVDGATVRWNGTPLATTVADPSHATASVPAADLAGAGELATALVTIKRPDGSTAGPLPFTVTGPDVAAAAAAVAQPGQTQGVRIVPAGGAPGLRAALSNATAGSSVATVTIAVYSGNPVGALFASGGGFLDLRVSGADASDSVAASFYYPASVTGTAEAALQLLYWTGAAWAPVLSSGGVAPAKDTTDNLDGTVSGGRFSSTFDATSTPKVTDLGGTVFALAPADARTLLGNLRALLAGMSLDRGLATDLGNKLDAAERRLGQGKDACAPLDDFVRTVTDSASRQRPKLTADQARRLVDGATAVELALGCPSPSSSGAGR